MEELPAERASPAGIVIRGSRSQAVEEPGEPDPLHSEPSLALGEPGPTSRSGTSRGERPQSSGAAPSSPGDLGARAAGVIGWRGR